MLPSPLRVLLFNILSLFFLKRCVCTVMFKGQVQHPGHTISRNSKALIIPPHTHSFFFSNYPILTGTSNPYSKAFGSV